MSSSQSAPSMVDRPLTSALAPAPGLRPFLQRRIPVGIILASFLLLTVPLTLLNVLGASQTTNFVCFTAYHITFSITHFFLTAWLYFDPRNVAYFNSSWQTRSIYFAAPIAILVVVWALGFFHVDPAYGDFEPSASWGPMAYAFFFAFAVRALDYRHSTRQSFGVLQLIKVQPGAKYPEWSKVVDRTFFTAMCLLELQTFASGGHFTPSPLMIASVVVTGGLFIGVMAGFLRAWREVPDRRVMLSPLAYFLFQTTAACLVVWRFELYAISLAMHFTEYHVLMAPRCFERVPKDGASAPAGKPFFLRRSWFAGYAVLIILALTYYMSDILELAGVQSKNQLLWAMTNMFNGIFLAHFFLESFVWKFSTPYFRTVLGPTYFPRPAPTQPSA
jgi:hypothetical protein